MVDISFSIEGTEKISRRLNIASDRVKSYERPFRQIGMNFMKTFDMNFDSRGGLYGGWAPRRPRYRGGQRVDTWPLMEKSGRMRRSFKSEADKDSLLLWNTARYFTYHQSEEEPRTRLPRRVMMKLREQDATMVVKEVQLYVIEVLREAGER